MYGELIMWLLLRDVSDEMISERLRSEYRI
jgi:hypothetical protein